MSHRITAMMTTMAMTLGIAASTMAPSRRSGESAASRRFSLQLCVHGNSPKTNVRKV